MLYDFRFLIAFVMPYFLMIMSSYSMLLSKGEKKTITVFIITLTCIYVTYIVGFRPPSMYGDTARYMSVYEMIASLSSSWSDGNYFYMNRELLFWPFAGFLKELGFSSRAWLLVISLWFFLVTLLSYKRIVKDENWHVLFVCLFLTYHLVFMNSIRQSMAESIVLLSYSFCVQKKWLKSIVLLVFATGFHVSAFFGIFFILLSYFKVSNKIIIISAFLGFVFSILLPSYVVDAIDYFQVFGMGDKIESYVVNGVSNEYENIWGLKQFQLVVITSCLYLALFYKFDSLLYIYVGTYFVIVLFTVEMPVVSGRMVQYISLVFPIMVWDIFRRFINSSPKLLSLLYPLLFVLISTLIMFNESAKRVLGLI